MSGATGTLTDAQFSWASSFTGIDLVRTGEMGPMANGAFNTGGVPGGTAIGVMGGAPGGGRGRGTAASHAGGGHGGSPGGGAPHKETERERNENALRGHTIVDIALYGRDLLQKQYDDMIRGLERAKAARVADIESWKPEQAPMSGNVLLGICKGLATVAKSAFPEVKFLEIAATGVELVIKGKEQIDKGVEASKDELASVKKAAHQELDKLIGGAKDQASNQRDKFAAMIEAEAYKLSHDELDAMEGVTELKKIGDFVRDKLGIARGEEHTPGVIKQMQVEIKNAFNRWVIDDFKRRKAGEGAHQIASKGGHSWESM